MSADSPVSFHVNVQRLPKKGMPVDIDADSRALSALAAAHGLVGVRSFSARLHVTSWKAGGVRVDGRVRADLIQQCVVTLDPVEAVIDEEVSALFVPEGSRLALRPVQQDQEMMLDPEGPDAPETFSGAEIDVGALAEEFFALAIDPYPRRQGAEADSTVEEGETLGPLAEKLALLRSRTEKS